MNKTTLGKYDRSLAKKDTRFKKGMVANPRGRGKGTVNRITEETKNAFAEVLTVLDPVELLHDWALNKPELFATMWKHLLPKDIKLETPVTFQKITHVIVGVLDKEDRESINVDTSTQDTGGQGGGYP